MRTEGVKEDLGWTSPCSPCAPLRTGGHGGLGAMGHGVLGPPADGGGVGSARVDGSLTGAWSRKPAAPSEPSLQALPY